MSNICPMLSWKTHPPRSGRRFPNRSLWPFLPSLSQHFAERFVASPSCVGRPNPQRFFEKRRWELVKKSRKQISLEEKDASPVVRIEMFHLIADAQISKVLSPGLKEPTQRQYLIMLRGAWRCSTRNTWILEVVVNLHLCIHTCQRSWLWLISHVWHLITTNVLNQLKL